MIHERRFVEFFFDYGSPFSYLADTQLPGIAAQVGALITHRPMLLGAVLKATGNSSPMAVPAKARHMGCELERWAKRYGVPFRAFASAKFGLRAVAQSMARELGPRNVHVAHPLIDTGVDTEFVRGRIRQGGGEEAIRAIEPDQLMNPTSIAESYWYLHNQERDAWTFELRPYKESW